MKLFTSFAVASLFTGSLIVACGGSSQNPGNGTTPDAGGNNTTPDSGSVTDSGPNTGDSSGPTCTTTSNCATGQTCCLGTTGARTCVTGACMGASVGCQSTGDCSAMGQVCCGSFTGTSAASTCQAGPCPSGEYELCTPGSSQCPTGETCNQPVAVIPVGYCQAAQDGGGNTKDGGDSGSNEMDSGADSGDATGE